MRALQKLVSNGSSTQVTIPRAALFYLGWLPGEPVILELTETKHVVIRKPAPDEFLPKRAVSILLDGTPPVAEPAKP